MEIKTYITKIEEQEIKKTWVSVDSLRKRLETAIMNEEYSAVMNILKELEEKDETNKN